MKMCRTCSKMAHKSVLRAIWKLRKFLSQKPVFSFIGSILGLIFLMILWELGFGLLIGIVDYMKGYNFRLDCLHLWATDWEYDRRQLELSGSDLKLWIGATVADRFQTSSAVWRRTSPTAWPARPRQAWARQLKPQHATESPLCHISFPAFSLATEL